MNIKQSTARWLGLALARGIIELAASMALLAGAGIASAETAYHFVRFPGLSYIGSITDSGVLLVDDDVQEIGRAPGIHVDVVLDLVLRLADTDGRGFGAPGRFRAYTGGSVGP